MNWIAAVMEVIKTGMAIDTQKLQGKLGAGVMESQAKSHERAADDIYATGVRTAQESLREARVMESDIQAAQAAGGGTTTDPGAVTQRAKAEELGQYNAMSAIFEAKSASNLEKEKADMLRSNARRLKNTSGLQSLSSGVSGVGGVMQSWQS